MMKVRNKWGEKKTRRKTEHGCLDEPLSMFVWKESRSQASGGEVERCRAGPVSAAWIWAGLLCAGRRRASQNAAGRRGGLTQPNNTVPTTQSQQHSPNNTAPTTQPQQHSPNNTAPTTQPQQHSPNNTAPTTQPQQHSPTTQPQQHSPNNTRPNNTAPTTQSNTAPPTSGHYAQTGTGTDFTCTARYNTPR